MIATNWDRLQLLRGDQFCRYMRELGKVDEYCSEAFDGLLLLGAEQSIAAIFAAINQQKV